MIYYLLAWTFLGITCSAIGLGVLSGLDAVDDCYWTHRSDRLLVAVWMGLLLSTVALLTVSLVLPLSTGIGFGVLLGLGALALWSSKTRRLLQEYYTDLAPRSRWMIAAVGVAIAAFMTQPVTWIDAGLYHYSAIQWLFEFGTVRGLGLVMTNLGFTSSWFAIAAPFNPPILDARATAVMNGFVGVILGLTLWQGWVHWQNRRARLPDYFILAFLGLFLPLALGLSLLSDIWVSPSPDFPVLVLVGVVAWSMLLTCDRALFPVATPMGTSAMPLILALGAINLKLTAIPLLGVASLFFVVQQRFRWRSLGLGVGLAVVLLAPMIVVSFLKTGCPLHPSTALCIDLPWSVLEADVAEAAADTHNWVSWYGTPPEGVFPWLWAFRLWFLEDKLNMATIALAAIALGGSVYLIPRLYRLSGGLWILLLAIAGFTFIMSTAPFLRFSLTYLLLPLALGMADFVQQRASRPLPAFPRPALSKPLFQVVRWQSVWSAIAIALSLAYTVVMEAVVLPPPMQHVTTTTQQVNGIRYSVPADGELCWATEIPCAFEASDTVELRNPAQGLRGGFVNASSVDTPSPAD